jgi:hypothetical protein
LFPPIQSPNVDSLAKHKKEEERRGKKRKESRKSHQILTTPPPNHYHWRNLSQPPSWREAYPVSLESGLIERAQWWQEQKKSKRQWKQ